MTDHEELSGRTALITGGTRGIGKGIAERLRARGAMVLVAARSLPDGASPEDVVIADVATSDGVAAFAAQARDRLGHVDIAVHNVGGSGQYEGGAANLTDDDWQSALDTNLLSAVRLDRALIPGMVERGSGGHRARHVDPASLPAADVDSLCGRKGGARELQQGLVERVGAERDSR